MLEAAYNRDPKPDKGARLEIVKQVSLGEKEVQVSSTSVFQLYVDTFAKSEGNRYGSKTDGKARGGNQGLFCRMRSHSTN